MIVIVFFINFIYINTKFFKIVIGSLKKKKAMNDAIGGKVYACIYLASRQKMKVDNI
jgi:hypothetical protein